VRPVARDGRVRPIRRLGRGSGATPSAPLCSRADTGASCRHRLPRLVRLGVRPSARRAPAAVASQARLRGKGGVVRCVRSPARPQRFVS
jgi:hypothetical protein